MASNEQIYFDVLREIAKDYAPVEKITEESAAKQGLSREEMLEYAYDNIQQMAAAAIKGKRRPSYALRKTTQQSI